MNTKEIAAEPMMRYRTVAWSGLNNATRDTLLDNVEELLPPVVVEDVLRTEVNSQFLVLTGGEGLDDLLNHIIVPEQKQIVPDTAMHCINIVPGEASLLVHFKNTLFSSASK